MAIDSLSKLVEQYSQAYGRKRLTNKEMLDKIKEFKATNNETIMTEMIGANIGLIIKDTYSIVKDYTQVETYIGSAIIGFIEGVKHFDVTRGINLANPNGYIFEWVRAMIHKDFYKDKAFLSGLTGKNKMIINALIQAEKTGSLSTPDLINSVANQLKEDKKTVASVHSTIGSKMSLSYMSGNDVVDIQYVENNPMSTINLCHIKSALLPVLKEILTERELTTIMARTMEDETLETIGKRLGVSKEAVRIYEKTAFKKLREDARIKALFNALD
jgi:RNA polymerase sigma factor (sigma-70 family)